MAEGTTPQVTNGSGAGLIAFLNWTIEKNELVDATASALRTGCLKVLSVEDDWEGLDLRTADLDNIINRFKNKHRMDMKDRTREQYEQRLRQSVDMYLKWLDDDPTWKPLQRKRTAPVNGGTGSNGRKAAAPSPSEVSATPSAAAPALPALPAAPGMISYPFPIRPGLRGTIQLPEDLSMREANRIAAFISTLAVEDEPEPLAIEAPRLQPWEGDAQ